MSPSPPTAPRSRVSAGLKISGTTARVITLRPGVTAIGTTGWMLRPSCSPFSGP